MSGGTSATAMETAAHSPGGTTATDAWLTPPRYALLLAVFVVATFPVVLLGQGTFVVRDFGLFGYPLAYFHRQCFWQGEWPLWNPLSYCGLPFLAQWNTLTLYPASAIYLLLPLTWSLPFFCILHLFWGGLGAFRLARDWTGQPLAAGLAGVLFAFSGLMLNFMMWPNNAASFGWLPWVIWLGQRGWREGGKMLAWGSVAAAMQVLGGGPETVAFTWLILVALAGGDCLTAGVSKGRLLCRLVGLGLLVALLCAVQLLPFLELLWWSQRDSVFASSRWSMPVWGWASFLVPLFRASPTAQGLFLQPEQGWTSSYYAGILTVWLVAVAVWRVRTWRVWVLGALLGVGLVLALGEPGGLYRALRAAFPAVGAMRFPVKFVILVLAIAPLLAAAGFASLTRRSPMVGPFEGGVVLVIMALIGGIIWVASTMPQAPAVWQATWQNGLLRAGFLAGALPLTIAWRRAVGRRRAVWAGLLLVLAWLDCVTHMPGLNPTASPALYAPGWASARLKLDPQPSPGQSRIMIAPWALAEVSSHVIPDPGANYLLNRLSFFADCNLLESVPQLSGFFSLVPAEINNVTVVAYQQTNRTFTALLDLAGVSQVTAPGNAFAWVARPSAMPFVTIGQEPLVAEDRAAFQELLGSAADFRRVVFLPPEARGLVTATRQPSASVREVGFANQRVTIVTEAPATSVVVIAQTYYPAWRAYVDGRPVRLWRANYAFQALEVPGGRHQVELRYEDRLLLLGAALSGLGVLATVVVSWAPIGGPPRGWLGSTVTTSKCADKPAGCG